jgi:hypothetical protein
MAEKIFAGTSLEQALKSDVVAPTGLLLTGMVKASENSGSVEFTNSGCGGWMTLPTDMIDQAEHLGYGTCKDHSHPVFRLTLKTPKDPQARILAELLTKARQQVQTIEMSQMLGGMPAGGAAGAQYPPGQPGQLPMSGGSQSLRIGGGGVGMGGGGVLGAWGCWDSTCTECLLYEYVCNGTACWSICKIWIEKPCERCIWPW